MTAVVGSNGEINAPGSGVTTGESNCGAGVPQALIIAASNTNRTILREARLMICFTMDNPDLLGLS